MQVTDEMRNAAAKALAERNGSPHPPAFLGIVDCVLEAALSAAPTPPADGWQPIETADKSKSRLMLGIVRGGVLEEIHIGEYSYAINFDEESCWWSIQCDDEIMPTHWRPLPAPPAGGDHG